MTIASEDGEVEFRETMLWRLADPEDRATLLRVGEMLNAYCLDVARRDGESAVRAHLRAAGRDLRHLQRYFAKVHRERAEEPELGTSSVPLEDIAGSCSQELARIADRIERELVSRLVNSFSFEGHD